MDPLRDPLDGLSPSLYVATLSEIWRNAWGCRPRRSLRSSPGCVNTKRSSIVWTP